MRIRRMLLFVICVFVSASAQGATYWVSDAGDDDALGTSESEAWETISKVNASAAAGDTVYFRRGDVFRGVITVRGANI